MKTMRFFWTLMSAVFALSAGISSAQEVTYMYEDFSNFGEYWNTEECTPYPGQEYFFTEVGLGGGNFGYGWVCDPQGSIFGTYVNTNLDGDYILLTRPIELRNDLVNVLSFEYWYRNTVSSDKKDLDVQIREENGDWNTIFSLRETGTNLPGNTQMNDLVILTLGEEYAGKTVEIGFRFGTVYSYSESYYMLLNRIKLAGYSNQAAVSFEVSNERGDFVYGQTYPLDFTFTGMGGIPVETIEISCGLDGKVTTFEVSMDSAMGLLEQQSYRKDVPLPEMEVNTENTLEFYVSKINGQEVSGSDKVEMVCTYADADILDRFVPLYESFSSAKCTYCPGFNNLMNGTLESLKSRGLLNVVKYAMNIPSPDRYYLAENTTRFNQYKSVFGWEGVPTAVYNGYYTFAYYTNPATNQAQTQALQTLAEKDSSFLGLVKIDIHTAVVDTINETLTVKVDLTPGMDFSARLFMIVLEGTTTGNAVSSMELEFHDVNMGMLSDARGSSETFKYGETISKTYTKDMSKTYAEELTDLKVLCFVQDAATNFIYQSAEVDVVPGDEAVANEQQVSANVILYPNPAHDQFYVSGVNNARIELYDMQGRMLDRQEKVSSGMAVSVSRWQAGNYIVRIIENGNVIVRKLNIAK